MCVCALAFPLSRQIWFKAQFLITVLTRGNYNLTLRAVLFFYGPTEMQQFVVAFWDALPPSHPLSSLILHLSLTLLLSSNNTSLELV